jgi:hypothetical protein
MHLLQKGNVKSTEKSENNDSVESDWEVLQFLFQPAMFVQAVLIHLQDMKNCQSEVKYRYYNESYNKQVWICFKSVWSTSSTLRDLRPYSLY